MLSDATMFLSDAAVVAIVTSIPATIGAIGALIVSLRNGQKVDAVQHTVDGNLTALKTELSVATNRILEMTTEVSTANSHIRKLLSPPVPGPAGPPGPPGPAGAAALIGITGSGAAVPLAAVPAFQVGQTETQGAPAP
jgi:hypothetical protein